MKKRLLQKIVAVMLLLCMTTGLVTITAEAATNISSVTIKVEDKGNDYPTVTLSSTDKYSIEDEGTWEDVYSANNYDRIRKTITLKAKDGYKFNGRNVRVTGSGKNNTNVSATRRSDSELTIRITYKMVELEEPDEAWWDSSNPGMARVSEVSGAKKYKFILYVDSDYDTEKTTNNPYYDFSSRLRKNSVYDSYDTYFEACAIDSAGNESEYVQSDTFNRWSSLQNSSSSSNNYNPPSVYPNQNYNSSVWPNGVGRPETSGEWVYNNGLWYFRKPNGQWMYDTWIVYHGEWYLISPQGYAYSNGWIERNGSSYYFYPAGIQGHAECEMARNTWIGGTYYVNNDGALVR